MSGRFGPTFLLGAAKLLAQKDPLEFSDASSLLHALRAAATPLIAGAEECSIGILDLAKKSRPTNARRTSWSD
jgi:hypothetical protein